MLSCTETCAGCESFNQSGDDDPSCGNLCRLPAPDIPQVSDFDASQIRSCLTPGRESRYCFEEGFVLPEFGCGDTCIAQRRNLPARSLPCAGQTEATCEQTLAAPCTPEDLQPPPVASAAPPLILRLHLRTAAAAVAVSVALLALYI